MAATLCCKQNLKRRCFKVTSILSTTATLVRLLLVVFFVFFIVLKQVVSLDLIAAELPIPILEVVLRTGAVTSKKEAKRLIDGNVLFGGMLSMMTRVFEQAEACVGLAQWSWTRISKFLPLTSRTGSVCSELARNGRTWFD